MATLLRSQKNELFAIIQTANMNPSDFRWVHLPDLNTNIINGSGMRHLTLLYGADQEFFFQFQQVKTPAIELCVFSPGDRHSINGYQTSDWSGILYLFSLWLQNLSAEINSLDLWSSIVEEKQLINDAAISEDASSFTQEEQRRIISSLNEIKAHIFETLSLSEPQKIIIEAKVRYLQEAPERLTKKDWGLLVIGQLLAIAVEFAQDPLKTKDLFRFAGHALSWVFQGIPLIP